LTDSPIIVGLWGVQGESAREFDKLREAGASRVIGSLAAARDLILATIPAGMIPENASARASARDGRGAVKS
jgi:hypothetical protein